MNITREENEGFMKPPCIIIVIPSSTAADVLSVLSLLSVQIKAVTVGPALQAT